MGVGEYTIPAPMDDVMGSFAGAIRLGPWSPCSILELVGSAVGKGWERVSLYTYILNLYRYLLFIYFYFLYIHKIIKLQVLHVTSHFLVVFWFSCSSFPQLDHFPF